MPLHDGVGINCKMCETTENQGTDYKYVVLGVCVEECECVI